MNRSRIIRRLGILGAVVWCAAMATAQHPATDPIDGNWSVTFTVQGQTVSGQMAFHAHGEKLNGTVETAHTGRGTLEGGAWLHDKMSGICVFQQHEAIALAGELRDGKLAGTFRTEGMGGTWEAVRSGSAAP